MSIRNEKKDQLHGYRGIELVVPTAAPISKDPLRFWTDHPTENTLVDLHVFATGESKAASNGDWLGPFSGRPELISELAVAIQSRLALAAAHTCSNYKSALRAFWRVCDQLESTVTPDGHNIPRLISVRDLTHLHEAAMHRANLKGSNFGFIVSIANDTRSRMRIRPLVWNAPKATVSSQHLIPDADAKALKIGIKRDWQYLRTEWERHDAIRSGLEPDTLSEFEKLDTAKVLRYAEENEALRRNWLYFSRIQKSTGKLLPTGAQLLDGATRKVLGGKGVRLTAMRAIAFPTILEANIAFHAALIGSGWNPSTLIAGVDATLPDRIFQHPKDVKQSVLAVDSSNDATEGETKNFEVTMQGIKNRAGGRLQFCMGLKKNPDSAPNVVASYLERTADLRMLLREEVNEAMAEMVRLKGINAPIQDQERQFKLFLNLQQGLRNVWLYVGQKGGIEWLNGINWRKLGSSNAQQSSYLEQLIDRLNVQRIAREEPPIAYVVPSDFRDIFARWVYLRTGGNIISIMMALGHSRLSSSDVYLEKNTYNAENDEAIRRFMTHFFEELERGRIDLTILAQLVRHGPMTTEMQERLEEYRMMSRSRINVACTDIKHPPPHISSDRVVGKRCSTHRCLWDCSNARFLPESLDGIAMRVEELMVISEHVPLNRWMQDDFEKELEAGEFLLNDLYERDSVIDARVRWREKIRLGNHMVPGLGLIRMRQPE